MSLCLLVLLYTISGVGFPHWFDPVSARDFDILMVDDSALILRVGDEIVMTKRSERIAEHLSKIYDSPNKGCENREKTGTFLPSPSCSRT